MMTRILVLLTTILLTTSCATAPPRRASKVVNKNFNVNPYGMNAFHPNGRAPDGHLVHFTDRNIERLTEGKVKWIRLMVDWRYCEPTKGQFNWAPLERVVTKLNAEGIGITACLYEPPDWARVPGSDFLVKPEDFEDFAKAIATQFKDRIAAYEIYNERPTGSWPKVAERAAAVYMPIQKAVYKGIKAGDPKALVIMTGLWEFPMYYLEDMYKLGAKGTFDAVNVHYYLRMDRDPHYMDAFRGDLDTVLKYVDYVTKKYDDGDIPVWFTEYGWPAANESQTFAVGPKLMADYMRFFLERTMASGLAEKVIWYVYYMPDGMALWHEGRNEKLPAFYVHLQATEAAPDWSKMPVKPLSYPKAASKPVEVPGGDLEDAAAWTVAEGTKVEFLADKPQSGEKFVHMTCRDGKASMTGKSFALEPGRAYELTGWIRMAGGLEDATYAHAMIQIELLDADGESLNLVGPRKGELKDDRSTNYYIADTGGVWYQVHYPIYTTDKTAGARIILNMGHPDAPNGAADFDNVKVQPLDLGKYDK